MTMSLTTRMDGWFISSGESNASLLRDDHAQSFVCDRETASIDPVRTSRIITSPADGQCQGDKASLRR